MSDPPLHPLYSHFSELPYSMRALFTAALIILCCGYLFALIYLFHAHSGRDGNPNTLRMRTWYSPTAAAERARALKQHCAGRCPPCCRPTRSPR